MGDKCKQCKGGRFASISAKSSDRNSGQVDGVDFEGYVPDNIGIGGGDYIWVEWCLDCGQIVGAFPAAVVYEDDYDSYDNGGHPDNFGDR